MTGPHMGELDGADLSKCVSALLALKGSQGVRVLELKRAEAERKAAFAAKERAAAAVRLNTTGTVQAKQDAVTLDPECQQLQDAYDVADTAENYAKRLANAEREDISILQTIAGLIKTALSLAGVQDRRVA